MDRVLRQLALVFAAGCSGGLANSLVVWLFGALGVTAAAGVALAPTWTPPWLYPRVVWGGIWGLLFLLPRPRRSSWRRGLVFSLAPTLVQLVVVFPSMGKGLLGLSLGVATPLFVLIFNAVWGLVTAGLLRAMQPTNRAGNYWSGYA